MKEFLNKLFGKNKKPDSIETGPEVPTQKVTMGQMEIDDEGITKKKTKGQKHGLFSDNLNKWRKEGKQEAIAKKTELKKAEKEAIQEVKLEEKPKKARPKWSKKSKVLFICLCSFLGVFIIAGSIALAVMADPLGSFDTVADQLDIVPTPTPEALPDRPADATPTPEPTLSPYEELMAYADLSILENTINIMLIGTDYAEERETWGGKHEYHSDVMIVVSINTETGKVDLISLPRDTYANIPGVEGIYKLNASINCGGGWPTEGGFEKVCEAAEWMLGGVPVDYYYAVDMSAVKGLVDAIGGLEFDLDISFDNQGREYEAGLQHMDGQAVLDYLRVRKDSHIEEKGKSGDLNRINRQKRMLIAIFNKIKSEGLLANIPKIIEAFDGHLYTNVSTMQTAGLVSFAYNINPDDIGMYSMKGKYHNIFNWLFVITDQKNRKNIIEEVYGFRPKEREEYDEESAKWLWEIMQREKILEVSEKYMTQLKAIMDEDLLRPVEPEPEPEPQPSDTGDTGDTGETGNTGDTGDTGETGETGDTGDTGDTTEPEPTPTPTPTPKPTEPPGGWRKYSEEEHQFFATVEEAYHLLLTWKLDIDDDDLTDEIVEELTQANIQFKEYIETLCAKYEIQVKSRWKYIWRVDYEKEDNEMYIDFR